VRVEPKTIGIAVVTHNP